MLSSHLSRLTLSNSFLSSESGGYSSDHCNQISNASSCGTMVERRDAYETCFSLTFHDKNDSCSMMVDCTISCPGKVPQVTALRPFSGTFVLKSPCREVNELMTNKERISPCFLHRHCRRRSGLILPLLLQPVSLFYPRPSFPQRIQQSSSGTHISPSVPIQTLHQRSLNRPPPAVSRLTTSLYALIFLNV